MDERNKAQIIALKTKLRARQNKPGFQRNAEVIAARIAELEERR